MSRRKPRGTVDRATAAQLDQLTSAEAMAAAAEEAAVAAEDDNPTLAQLLAARPAQQAQEAPRGTA